MPRKAIERIAFVVFFACVTAFYFWTADARLPALGPQPSSYDGMLTNAFLHGRLDLLESPDPRLLALADPYDPAQNAPYRLHDALLYHSRYYMYWGVAPVLLAYLPVRLLTGGFLHDNIACAAFASAGLLFYLLLLALIKRDLFPNAGSVTTALLMLVLAFGSMIPFVIRRPVVYEVAITCGYCMTAAFAYFAYRAVFRERLAVPSLWAAAIALAFAFLSRPNVAACALLVTVGIALLVAGRRLTVRRALRLAAIAFGPLALAIAGQALYNHARFGSFTEFGIKYQLAGLKMATYPLFSATRAVYSGLIYLVNAPAFGSYFPFAVAQPVNLQGPFATLGEMIRPYLPLNGLEPAVGLFAAVPSCIALAAVPAVLLRAHTGDRVRGLLIGILLWALVTGSATASFGGSTLRYEVDFVPALLLAAAICTLWIAGAGARSRTRPVTVALLACATAYTVVLSVALSMTGYDDQYERAYPAQFARLTQAFGPLERLSMRAQGYPGIVRARIGPPGCPPGGLGQPLLASGSAGSADFLSLHCTASPGEYAVAWDHWGVPATLGTPFRFGPAGTTAIELDTPALFPPASAEAAAVDPALNSCIVRADGRTVFAVSPCATYPAGAAQISLFANTIGGTTTMPVYTGSIDAVERLGPLRLTWSRAAALLLVVAAMAFVAVLRRTGRRGDAFALTAAIVIAFVAGGTLAPVSDRTQPAHDSAAAAPARSVTQTPHVDDRIWKDRLSTVSVTHSARADSRIDASLVVQNASPAEWAADGAAPVIGGYRWIDAKGVAISEGRFRLAPAPRPGEARRIEFSAQTPRVPGRYHLRVDLLCESIGWFESHGNAPVTLAIRITG